MGRRNRNKLNYYYYYYYIHTETASLVNQQVKRTSDSNLLYGGLLESKAHLFHALYLSLQHCNALDINYNAVLLTHHVNGMLASKEHRCNYVVLEITVINAHAQGMTRLSVFI